MSKAYKKSISLILTLALIVSAFLSLATVYADDGQLVSGNSTDAVNSQANESGESNGSDDSNTPGSIDNAPAQGDTTKTETSAEPAEPQSAEIEYKSHVQREGWQGWRDDGDISGTTGRSLRVEALVIKLSTGGLNGDIQYRTHVQNEGWQKWVNSDEMSGTQGKSRRVEAIQIKLTGELEQQYDIYYRLHVQSFGWMEWVKNGEIAGTSGFSRRAESLQIKLYPKGQGPENSTENDIFVFDGKDMYYRDLSSNIVKGWKTFGKSSRYFNASTGVMTRGWATIGRYKYYFDPGSGVMCKGWQTIGGRRYYFDSQGRAVTSTGWKKIGRNYFYFNNGVARTGNYSYNGYTVNSGKYGVVSSTAYRMAMDKRFRAAQYAAKYIGTPYRAGGTSLTRGVDCSGFIYALYQSMGVDIVRVGFGNAYGTIPVSEAKPGDILYYPGHYSLYIGNGKEIHAVTRGVLCTDVGYIGTSPRHAIRVPV